MAKEKKSKNKRSGKKPTELSLTCICGAQSRVYAIGEKGYMAHCPACGALTFFRNEDLLERLSYGSSICPHKIDPKPCTGGRTTWCPVCRVRTFYPSVT